MSWLASNKQWHNHYHPVEPEARRMKVGDTNRYAYNAQAVADEKEGIIVACEATRQETDAGQLVPMIQQARENLGDTAQNTTTLADTGYGAGADLPAAAEKGLSILVPPAEGKPARDNPYATPHFDYDPQPRSVIWPNPKSTRARVAEAIGLGSRAESSPANQFPLCLRFHPMKILLRQSPLRRPRRVQRAESRFHRDCSRRGHRSAMSLPMSGSWGG
jgi:hypothetical protein